MDGTNLCSECCKEKFQVSFMLEAYEYLFIDSMDIFYLDSG